MHSIPFFSLLLLSLLAMAFLLLPLITALIMASTDAQLPLCSAHQACGARISRFPLKEETVGNIVEEIGSGQGSGQEVLSTEPMLYDENVDTVTSFDFDAQPEVEDQYLCRCSEDGRLKRLVITYIIRFRQRWM